MFGLQKRRARLANDQNLPALVASDMEPKVIVIRENLFTGRRRPRVKRVCACGCGETFTTTFEDKLYKNETHKKRKKRKMSPTREGTKSN